MLFEDDLAISEDLDQYSFSAEPAETFKGLTNAQKVGRLDLNALGRVKRCLPRYLFRAYGPTSGGASPKGQYKDLNSEDAITPHAFHKINGTITGHNSASEIPDPATMINGHIYTSCTIRSEFSSWSPSLLLALCYAEQKYNYRGSAHVCVIDTYKILNGVYHVPNLIHVGLVSSKRRTTPLGELMDPYPEEYLVHWVVTGAGYVALSYAELGVDILKVYPEIRNSQDWGYYIRDKKFAPAFPPVKIAEEHIELLKGIAQRFNRPELVYPLTISLICLAKRFDLTYTTQQFFDSPDFAFYAKSLRSMIVPMDLAEQWLVKDLQFTGNMSEVRQTKTMMRALVISKYGRGKRATLEDVTAQLEAVNIKEEKQDSVKEAKERYT